MEACQQIIEPQLDAFRSAGALTPEVAWRTMAMVGTATSSQGSVTPMGAVTYFVRMVAREGKAEEVQQLLLENPRRIEQGERRSVSAVQGGAAPAGRPRQRAVRQLRPGQGSRLQHRAPGSGQRSAEGIVTIRV